MADWKRRLFIGLGWGLGTGGASHRVRDAQSADKPDGGRPPAGSFWKTNLHFTVQTCVREGRVTPMSAGAAPSMRRSLSQRLKSRASSRPPHEAVVRRVYQYWPFRQPQRLDSYVKVHVKGFVAITV